VRFSLDDLGIDGEIIDDIEVAVSEASTNVLEHSATDEEYEVRVNITDSKCVISVIAMAGDHFSHAEVGLEPADLDADGGRGIHLVRSLVDELRFTMDGERGVAVQFIKHLTPSASDQTRDGDPEASPGISKHPRILRVGTMEGTGELR
jgi:serine/threonine-protein kinase RsbW